MTIHPAHRRAATILPCAIVALLSTCAHAAGLPAGPEQQSWSRLSLGAPAGGYDAGTLEFAAIVTGSGELEIGSAFGPDNPGFHYGPAPAAAGGVFAARLEVAGVRFDNSGAVVDGGSVTVSFLNGLAGSVGDDYGLAPTGVLLAGSVTEVLLDDASAGALDLLFQITGGALQSPTNAEVGLEPFAPSGLGLLRFTDFAESDVGLADSFPIDDATLQVFGLPATSVPGDFDGDGDVDVDDFGVFVNSFQLSPQGGPPFANGDFDEDGDVDVDDFGVFVNSVQAFLPTVTPAVESVPEPTAAALLSTQLFGWRRRPGRRKKSTTHAARRI